MQSLTEGMNPKWAEVEGSAVKRRNQAAMQPRKSRHTGFVQAGDRMFIICSLSLLQKSC